MNEVIEKASLIEEKIGYFFKEKKLLALAFVHRSYHNEHKEHVKEHNERLEFLGDTVLGLLISDYLYIRYPDLSEGELSQMRSNLIESAMCARFLLKLGISKYILLGKGEQLNEGRGRETILADLFEALLGAIYLDGGIDVARDFFFRHFETSVQSFIQEPSRNWKAEFQDYSQKKFQVTPFYKVEKETGPDHAKTFHVVAYNGDIEMGKGCGSSKKQGEQAAAENALKRLKIV